MNPDNLGPQFRGTDPVNGNLQPEQFGPFHRYDDSMEAAHHNVKWNRYHKVDAWGRPLMQPYDGHDAWSCNNYECAEHPAHLYEQEGVQSMPGWMQHENDPQKDAKFEVDKAFHESGLSEDAQWLLNQQKQGPRE